MPPKCPDAAQALRAIMSDEISSEKNTMGNTNLPQFGAEDQKNSLDTRRGLAQLTEAQRKEGDPEPGRINNPNPAVSTGEALAGYTDSGHSPAGAT